MKKKHEKRDRDSDTVTKTMDIHSVCLIVSSISFELVNIPKHFFSLKKTRLSLQVLKLIALKHVK